MVVAKNSGRKIFVLKNGSHKHYRHQVQHHQHRVDRGEEEGGVCTVGGQKWSKLLFNVFLSSGIVLKIWRNFKILIFWKLLKLIKKFRVSFLKINANLTAPKFLQRKTQVLACKLKWFVDKAGSSSLTQFASTTLPSASAVGNLRSHLPLSGGRPSYPVRGQTRSSPGKLS